MAGLVGDIALLEAGIGAAARIRYQVLQNDASLPPGEQGPAMRRSELRSLQLPIQSSVRPGHIGNGLYLRHG